jgi:putative transposase
MKVVRAYRYEMVLNVQLRINLAKNAGASRFSFNWGLAQRIDLYNNSKKSTNAIEQHRIINKLKQTEYPWMYDVSKCSIQEALRDLDKSFGNFFRGIKKNSKIGFPKFKKKGHRDSFRLTGTIKVQDDTIQLPRLGKIKLKEKTKVKGKILSATVTREADRWFVSVTVEEEIEDPKPVEGNSISVDVGLTHFATLSDGSKISAPKPLIKHLKILKRRSSQHSRKKLGSNNRKKSALKLARIHRKVRNKRKDFLHKESTKLAKTKSVIVIEDLNVKEMVRNKKLSKHIYDAGWSEFRRMLEYKTKWYGSKLILAPRFYPSSKICSKCGNRLEELSLKIREWQCENCQTIHDRDVNAAINLLKFSTGSSSGIYACGDTSNGASSKKTCSYVSLKQEVIMS